MPGKTKNGKTPYKFIGKATSFWVQKKKAPLNAILLPCRQCIGCRLEKSREWATRLIHEIPSHPSSCFLTLTYDEEHLPVDGSLNPSHLKTFFKDLRARMSYYGKEKIKYFACGEYGDQSGRPHYHAALFGPIGCYGSNNLPTPGSIREELARSGSPQFSHPDLAATWPHGRHRFSALTFESAAYVARYILKKVTGTLAEAHYGDRTPEFQRPSKGLGESHVLRWTSDIYPGDHVVLPGRGSFMPPAYYDRVLEKVDPVLYEKVKAARKAAQEKLTGETFLELVNERHREGEVRTLVTDQTLIRGLD